MNMVYLYMIYLDTYSAQGLGRWSTNIKRSVVRRIHKGMWTLTAFNEGPGWEQLINELHGRVLTPADGSYRPSHYEGDSSLLKAFYKS